MRLVRTHLHLHLQIQGGAVIVPALSLLGWLILRSLKGMGRRDSHGGVLTVGMMWELGRLQTVVRGQCGGG